MSRNRDTGAYGHLGDNTNLLINGGSPFYGFVSQRGDFVTSPTVIGGDEYSVDRWQHSATGSSSNYPTVQVVGGYVRTTCANQPTINAYTQQVVEDGESLVGQTLTLSGKCNTDSADFRAWVIDNGVWVSLGSITGDFSFTFTKQAANVDDHFRIRFSISDASDPNIGINAGGEYFELAEVKLELGSVATPFESEPYGDVLAKCQRYYFQQDTNWLVHRETALSASYTHRLTGYLPTSMRTNSQTVTLLNTSNENLTSAPFVDARNKGNIAFNYQPGTTSGGTGYGFRTGIAVDAEL